MELTRKLTLSGLISVFGRGTIEQVVLATIVCFGFFALSVKEIPFNTGRLNFFKLITEFQLFGILLSLVVIQTDARGLSDVAKVGTIQIILALAIVPITLYSIVAAIFELHQQATVNAASGEVDNPTFETEDRQVDMKVAEGDTKTT